MKNSIFEKLVSAQASAEGLTKFIIGQLASFNTGKTVEFDFLTQAGVGHYCSALGYGKTRNWSKLTLDKIAPKSSMGPNAVPGKEAKAILGQLQMALEKKWLVPKESGKPQPDIISDFLPKGQTFFRKKTLGHMWEFQYALAVELEHGKTRGANVTNNHPLLTAMVVVAHISEDKLYYARLWDMETGGELFNAQLEKKPTRPILEEHLKARGYLQSRLQEKLA